MEREAPSTRPAHPDPRRVRLARFGRAGHGGRHARHHQLGRTGAYRSDRDERRTADGLDTFSDSKFVIATGVSVLALLLTTVLGPLQAFLKITSLDARQWLTCLAVALSIVVAAEIRKAVRRHIAASHQDTR
jgi:hypothetical protein